MGSLWAVVFGLKQSKVNGYLAALFHLRSLSPTQLTSSVHSSVPLLQCLETVSDVRMDHVVEEEGSLLKLGQNILWHLPNLSWQFVSWECYGVDIQKPYLVHEFNFVAPTGTKAHVTLFSVTASHSPLLRALPQLPDGVAGKVLALTATPVLFMCPLLFFQLLTSIFFLLKLSLHGESLERFSSLQPSASLSLDLLLTSGTLYDEAFSRHLWFGSGPAHASLLFVAWEPTTT